MTVIYFTAKMYKNYASHEVREFFQHLLIPIPSHSRIAIPIPIPVLKLYIVHFPFPWDSHGKNWKREFPLPMNTSTPNLHLASSEQ